MKKTIKIVNWIETEEEVELVFPIYRKYTSKHDLYLYESYFFLDSDNKCYEVNREQSEGSTTYGVSIYENFEINHEFFYNEDGYLDSNKKEFLDALTQYKHVFNIWE